jgi:hypothetical protein
MPAQLVRRVSRTPTLTYVRSEALEDPDLVVSVVEQSTPQISEVPHMPLRTVVLPVATQSLPAVLIARAALGLLQPEAFRTSLRHQTCLYGNSTYVDVVGADIWASSVVDNGYSYLQEFEFVFEGCRWDAIYRRLAGGAWVFGSGLSSFILCDGPAFLNPADVLSLMLARKIPWVG